MNVTSTMGTDDEMHQRIANTTIGVENGTFPWYVPNKNTAVWMPCGFLCGVFLTCIIVKCCRRNQHKLSPNARVRKDSYYQENAVYWDHGSDMVEIRDHRRRTEVEIFDHANIRNVQTQTDIDYRFTEFFESEYAHPDFELDNMSLAPPPPPPPPDPLPPISPPRRRSKDDCFRTMPSYRKSYIPSRLQNTWSIYKSEDKLASSNYFADFLDEAFKDRNSPLHQEQDHYMSVPSVVLIPNNFDEAPPTCHEILRHSYINLKGKTGNVSEMSSLDKSQSNMADYENTKVWVKSKESDLSDDETHVDCRDQKFQECVRNTLSRRETQSHTETDDQYSAFASLSLPKKPERPRTGYVVMELTEEVMSFLKVRDKKLSQCKTSSDDISSSEIYYDDRVKNGYISMLDHNKF